MENSALQAFLSVIQYNTICLKSWFYAADGIQVCRQVCRSTKLGATLWEVHLLPEIHALELSIEQVFIYKQSEGLTMCMDQL